MLRLARVTVFVVVSLLIYDPTIVSICRTSEEMLEGWPSSSHRYVLCSALDLILK